LKREKGVAENLDTRMKEYINEYLIYWKSSRAGGA